MKKINLIFFIICSQQLFAQIDSVKSAVYRWNNLQQKKEETRVRREVVEGKTLDLSYFEVHTSTIEPGKAPHPPHSHVDTEEVIIVNQGTLNVTINGVSKILPAGSIAVAMPGDLHGIENAGNTVATYYILKLKSQNPMNIERANSSGGSFTVNWDTVTIKKTDRGERRNMFERPTSQFSRFEMHVTTLNAGQVSHAPHMHRAEEVVLIKTGNAEMQIGDKFYPASAGDLIFLGSGILHASKNTGTEPLTYFAFQWAN